MFTALKKLVGSEAGQFRDRNIPAGLQSMNQSLQRRFAKGVQYNSEYKWCFSSLWQRGVCHRKMLTDYLAARCKLIYSVADKVILTFRLNDIFCWKSGFLMVEEAIKLII